MRNGKMREGGRWRGEDQGGAVVGGRVEGSAIYANVRRCWLKCAVSILVQGAAPLASSELLP